MRVFTCWRASNAPVWLWSVVAFAMTSPQVAAAAGADANAPIMIAGLAPDQPEQVFVWGLRQDGIGRASSSSEGQVNFAEFQDRPLLRPGELLEVVPGLAVTQHSGSGKANQYF